MVDNTSFQSYFKNAKLKQKAYSTVRDIASKWSSEAPPAPKCQTEEPRKLKWRQEERAGGGAKRHSQSTHKQQQQGA